MGMAMLRVGDIAPDKRSGCVRTDKNEPWDASFQEYTALVSRSAKGLGMGTGALPLSSSWSAWLVL